MRSLCGQLLGCPTSVTSQSPREMAGSTRGALGRGGGGGRPRGSSPPCFPFRMGERGMLSRRFWDYVGRHRREYYWGYAAVVASILMAQLSPWALKLAIDGVRRGTSSGRL